MWSGDQGSADLTPRDSGRLVEIRFPLLNPRIVRRLRDGIHIGVPVNGSGAVGVHVSNNAGKNGRGR